MAPWLWRRYSLSLRQRGGLAGLCGSTSVLGGGVLLLRPHLHNGLLGFIFPVFAEPNMRVNTSVNMGGSMSVNMSVSMRVNVSVSMSMSVNIQLRPVHIHQ